MNDVITSRQRSVKLTENPETNVKLVATYRLDRTLNAITNLGRCAGINYVWTEHQIKLVEDSLTNAVRKCVANIKNGKTQHAVTIQL